MLTWDEVTAAHGSTQAVKIHDGVAVSVLCGQLGLHANVVFDDWLRYSLPNRRYYEHALRAFQRGLEKQAPVRAFRKIATNKWEILGVFRIVQIDSNSLEHTVVMTKLPKETWR